MKNSLKLLALAVLAAGASLLAQDKAAASTSEVGPGLLGQRYAELSISYLDVNHSNTNAWGPSVVVNSPINSYLDASVSWSRAEDEGDGEFQINGLAGAVTGYLPLHTGNAFGTFSVGYDWVVPGKDDWSYTVEGGYEYAFCASFAARVSAGYTSDFDDDSNASFDGTIKGIYKISDRWSATASFSVIEGGHLGYAVGGVFKF